jgi:hypothetical protein
MTQTKINTSLIISCSLSLILIGLFIFIDKDKVDIDDTRSSNYFTDPKQEDSSEGLCTSNNFWITENLIGSKDLNKFLLNQSAYLSPDLYRNVGIVHECITDKTLLLTSTVEHTNNQDHLENEISRIISNLQFLILALEERKAITHKIELSISIPEI